MTTLVGLESSHKAYKMALGTHVERHGTQLGRLLLILHAPTSVGSCHAVKLLYGSCSWYDGVYCRRWNLLPACMLPISSMVWINGWDPMGS
jgi:hypothetical protein